MFADPRLQVEQVVKGFGFATGMAFLDSHNILVIEKNTGKVVLIKHGQISRKPVLDVNVANDSERGLLGIAIAKKIDSTSRYVFLYYTEAENRDNGKVLGNRLYRYDLVGHKLINPKLLLNLPYLPGPSHDGGVLKVSPDNRSIYLTVGNINFIQNQTYMTKAQNVKLGPEPDGRGGILRVTFDGKVVGGHGILGENDPLNKYFGYGLRNSFGIGFDPITRNLWDTENGQSRHDEVNLVKPGFNSGWKIVQGLSTRKQDFDLSDLENFDGRGVYRDPEFEWFNTVAPTSVLFFNSDKMGKEYENDLFVGSASNGTIYHFDLTQNRMHLFLDGPLGDKVADTQDELRKVMFAKGFGIITDLEIGRDGYLYGVSSSFTHGGSIFRIIGR